MKKITTLTLTGAATQQTCERGKLEITKGKKAVGLRLKVTLSLANASGGTVTLTDSQKQNLLANFIANLDYGNGSGVFRPFQGVDFRRLHHLQRLCFQSEMEGYTDATTGLAQAMLTATTYPVVFYPIIPLGKFVGLRNLQNFIGGLGRSGMKTVQLELKRIAAVTIVSGVTITGNVTVDLIPELVSSEGDCFGIVPAWFEKDEVDRVARSPEGLILYASERTAVHASTALTNGSTWIDEEQIHDQVSPAETITETNDHPELFPIGLLTDRETVLYLVDQATPYKDIPTGAFKFIQNVKDLGTFKLGCYYVPIATASELASVVEYVATSLRKKVVRMASMMGVEGGGELPVRLQPFSGFRFLDTDDKEIEQFGGLQAAQNTPAAVVVPNGVRAQVQALSANHRAAGEMKAADSLAKRVAAQIPGSVQSARGFSGGRGTPILGGVRSDLS